MCGVSARALRFYEKNGLITPDRVDEVNRYRYYSYDTMRRIQTIRYLLDEGFPLATIKEILKKDDLNTLKDLFSEQITETEAKIRFDKQRLASLRTWHGLLEEGSNVLEHRDTSVRIRYVERRPYFHFQHRPKNDEERTEAFIETAYLTRSMREGNGMIDMGGDFNILYPSYRARIDGSSSDITLLQTVYPDSQSVDNTIEFGGFHAVACYHIGPTDNIGSTYLRMLDWASSHGHIPNGTSLERKVLDIYSVGSAENNVTEVLFPLENEPDQP